MICNRKYNFYGSVKTGLIGFYLGDVIFNIFFQEDKTISKILYPSSPIAFYMAVVTVSLFSAITSTFLDTIRNNIFLITMTVVLADLYANLTKEEKTPYNILIKRLIEDLIATSIILMIIYNIEENHLLDTELRNLPLDEDSQPLFISFVFLGIYQMARKYRER